MFKLRLKEESKVCLVMLFNNNFNVIQKKIQHLYGQTISNWTLFIICDENIGFVDDFHKLEKINKNKNVVFEKIKTNNHYGYINHKIKTLTNEFSHFTVLNSCDVFYPNYLKLMINQKKYFVYGNYHVSKCSSKNTFLNDTNNNINNFIENYQKLCVSLWSAKLVKGLGTLNLNTPEPLFDYYIRTLLVLKPTEISYIQTPLGKCFCKNNNESYLNSITQTKNLVKDKDISTLLKYSAIMNDIPPRFHPLVIMPTYNRANNIEERINMMINQIYENWTFVIIDDGSTIENKKKYYKMKEDYSYDNRIIFLENENNSKVPYTLNKGIYYFLENENLTHLTWISDDNIYYTNYLSDLFVKNKDFVYSSYDILNEINNSKGINCWQYRSYESLLNRFAGCASFMWSRKAIKNIGFYNEEVPGCEDYEYLLRTFKYLKITDIEYVNKTLMSYVVHIKQGTHIDRDHIFKLKDKITNKFVNLYKISMEPKISIVMGYYNRKHQTLETLKNFEKRYANKYNFEVIIVDDNSNKENNLENDIRQFTYDIKLIVITENEKRNRINSSSVYNRGFQEVTGEIVIIQNPECLHLGDLMNYIKHNFLYDRYLVFPCYNSNNYNVNNYIYKNIDNISINTIEGQTKDFNLDEKYGKFPIWYQNKELHDKKLHFCTVICNEYLQMLKGFSEIYSDGVCYEDDDFLFKIENILKLDTLSVPLNSGCGVVHLYHERSAGVNISENEIDIKKKGVYTQFLLNQNIHRTILSENNKISCPKIFHYYWDDFKKLSYLNFYSLKTSVYYHPDYIHVIWCPKNPNSDVTWNEFCNKEHSGDNKWVYYLNLISSMRNVTIIYKNMDQLMNISNTMSEIHKSDLFRYYIIERYGGIWSDLDIVYIKPITDIINFDFNTINFLCKNGGWYYIPIGLLISKRKGKFYDNIFKFALINYDKTKYQSMGAELFAKLYLKNNLSMITKNNNNHLCLKSNDKDIFLDEHFYMYYNWTKINELFIHDIKINVQDEKKIAGFHWFNGSNNTKKYLNEMKNIIIPTNYQGIIFKDKLKIHIKCSRIVYFKFHNIWTTFFDEKIDTYINIIKKYYPSINIVEIDINNYNDMGHQHSGNILNILKQNLESIIIYDELSYSWLLRVYMSQPLLRKDIERLSCNSNYIVFFCELFDNDELQIIGSKVCNIEFSKMFFQNARQICLCNTKNRVYLSKHNIIHNITYFPPIGYSENIELNYEKTKLNKDCEIDLLFYGTLLDSFEYRNKCIQNIKQYSDEMKYKFVFENNIEKDILCSKSKIIIHVPSHENLYTFPWAKVGYLIQNKHFFIIEENEELYIQKMENIIVYYKRGDMNDLQNKIDYYLNNETERNNITQKLFEYFKYFDIDKLIYNIVHNNF